MKKKLRLKHQTYHRRVMDFNKRFNPERPLADPSYEEIDQMPITDPFWDGGDLSHPEELWASEPETKDGIQAFLTVRAAREELSRIGREVRHLLNWACQYQQKLNAISAQQGVYLLVSVPCLLLTSGLCLPSD